MRISTPVAIVLSATNVNDYTEEFVVTMQRNFPTDQEMQFGGNIYRNLGDLIKIPTYDAGATYAVGDIAFKSGFIQKVKANDELAPLQPEAYSTGVDTSTDSAIWNKRYVRITTVFSGSYTYTLGNYKHTFIDNVSSGGYVIHTVEDLTTGETFTFEPVCEYAVTNSSAEKIPEVYSSGLYGFKYMIKIGTNLYARTHVATDIEYTSITGADFQPISHIAELGGFVKIKSNAITAPFDGKNYSVAKSATTMTYTIKCLEKFDTLALGAIKGDSVSVVFKDAGGTPITTVTDFIIDGKRDVDGRLSDYKTTVILYSTADILAGGTIEITISGGIVELGTIMAGLSVDAGFTKLQFSNRFNDHSPYSKDNFGFVEYIDGVKALVHSGTVDVPLSRYDMTNRLLVSLGGNTIILNGSDTTDNSVPNNQSTFASTMLIGRWKASELKNKVKDKQIEQMATYGFTMTEQI